MRPEYHQSAYLCAISRIGAFLVQDDDSRPRYITTWGTALEAQGLSKMKISRIFAHRVELPLGEGTYNWSGGKSVAIFDSTLVGVETECGMIGYGEVCPLGPCYLPAYAEGVKAGLREPGLNLIGLDPRELGQLNYGE